MGRDRDLLGEYSPQGEEGGHSFLTGQLATASHRWQGRGGQRLRALRRAGERLLDLENHDKPELDHLGDSLKRLSFTDKDLLEAMEDRENFDAFKSELRKKGAITNLEMKEGIHLFVQNQLQLKRASDSPTTIPTPSSSTSSSSSDSRSRTFSFGSQS